MHRNLFMISWGGLRRISYMPHSPCRSKRHLCPPLVCDQTSGEPGTCVAKWPQIKSANLICVPYTLLPIDSWPWFTPTVQHPYCTSSTSFSHHRFAPLLLTARVPRRHPSQRLQPSGGPTRTLPRHPPQTARCAVPMTSPDHAVPRRQQFLPCTVSFIACPNYVPAC